MTRNVQSTQNRDLTAVMFPVHDHFEDEFTVLRDFTGSAFGMRPRETFDGYHHDPRCSGECAHGGGCQIVGFPCDQRCPGCNMYLVYQAHEKGLVVG